MSDGTQFDGLFPLRVEGGRGEGTEREEDKEKMVRGNKIARQ